jgi:putative oxidoreductase
MSALLLAIFARLNTVPYTVLAVPLRLAVAIIFWYSGQTKLADWNATLFLFQDEYKFPLLPPELAATIAASLELSMPVFLVLGLCTRFAACILLGMTASIQIFVYPNAWPAHVQWLALMLPLICWGPGKLALDHLIAGWYHDRRLGTV